MSLAPIAPGNVPRPDSSLPTIKCSSCSEEIEISALATHTCGSAPPPPRARLGSFSNPFTLRPALANSHNPVQPSPLSQSQAPGSRDHVGSKMLPTPKAPRTAPPRINPDAANRPYLAPRQYSDSPISPGASIRSAGGFGGKTGMLRSMTSPIPRLWNPRPPSEELSANLDCAFPPFPAAFTSNSRPGSRNGSERGESQSRQGDASLQVDKSPFGFEPKSPRGGEAVLSRMNTLKSGPFAGKRPIKDEKTSNEPSPLDRRRPSLPRNLPFAEAPPRSSTPSSVVSDTPRPSTAQSLRGPSPNPSFAESDVPPLPKTEFDMRIPPQRPNRPTEDTLSPQFLDEFSAEPVSDLSPYNLSEPPIPAKSAERGNPQKEDFGEAYRSGELLKMPSEPSLHGVEERPPFPGPSMSEPAQVSQARSLSPSSTRNEPRMDSRMENAPPVPKAVQQLTRKLSHHSPSESASSVASSENSMGNRNSSGDPSPIGSAASSIDAFSPLSYETKQYQTESAMKVSGLNVRNQDDPGMRAEQPWKRVPSPKSSQPAPPPETSPPEGPLPPPPRQTGDNWPLESPMDPAMDGQRFKADEAESWHWDQKPGPSPPPPNQPRQRTLSDARQQPPPPGAIPNLPPLTVPKHPGDGDQYRAFSPQRPDQRPPPPGQQRSRSKTNTGPRPPPPLNGQPDATFPRSQTPQPMRPPPMRHNSPVPRMQSPGPRMQSPGPGMQSPGPRKQSFGAGMQPPGQQMRSPGGWMPPPGPRNQSFGPRTGPPMPRPPPPQSSQSAPLPHPHPPPPPEPQQPETPVDRPGLIRRATTINGKSICRGCSLQIEGKSVKAADGRLTGRWHKTCFVCRTCQQPFTTADFYVIDNHPYCEQHYHEKNGSLCRGCNRGIEGDYLETASASERGKVHNKYHPRCFTCVDCRTVLSDDYFEIASRVYCERHALAAMRGQARAQGLPGQPIPNLLPSNLRAERRTTKLMAA